MSNQVRIVRNITNYPDWTFGIILKVNVPELSTGWMLVSGQKGNRLHQTWVRVEDCEEVIVNTETILKVVENNLPKYENSPQLPVEKIRPPIGIIPRYIYEERRCEEIVEAITRFIQHKTQIPIEWVEEYNELVTKNRK